MENLVPDRSQQPGAPALVRAGRQPRLFRLEAARRKKLWSAENSWPRCPGMTLLEPRCYHLTIGAEPFFGNITLDGLSLRCKFALFLSPSCTLLELETTRYESRIHHPLMSVRQHGLFNPGTLSWIYYLGFGDIVELICCILSKFLGLGLEGVWDSLPVCEINGYLSWVA